MITLKIKNNMSSKFNFKLFLSILIRKIRKFFPYFLGLYLLFLGLSYYNVTIKEWFSWGFFHIEVAFFGLIYLVSILWSGNISIKKIYPLKTLSIKTILRKASLVMELKTQHISKTDKIRIGSIITIMFIALLTPLSLISNIMLLYGLITFFYVLDSRGPALGAVLFLIFIPFLISFRTKTTIGSDAVTELLAVIAFEFLIIAIFTKIREILKK